MIRHSHWVQMLLQLLAPPTLCPAPDLHPAIFEHGGDNLVKIAFLHQLAPMLHHGLMTRGLAGQLSRRNAEALEATALLNADRARLVLLQMQEMARLLSEQGARPVFLKGTGLLAAGVMPDAGMRQFGDIDVLVEPELLEPCAKALMAAGCEYAVRDFVVEKYEDAGGAGSQHFPALRHHSWPALVELHHAFEADNRFDGVRSAQILSGAQTGQAGVFHPEPRQMLQMAVLHGLRRGIWNKVNLLSLRDLLDIAWLQDAYPELGTAMTFTQRQMKQVARVNDHWFEGFMGVGRLLGTHATPASRLMWRLQCFALDHPAAQRKLNAVMDTLAPRRARDRIWSVFNSPDYRRYLGEKWRAGRGAPPEDR